MFWFWRYWYGDLRNNTSSYRPLSPLSPPHSPVAIVTMFLISMSLVIFCLLFSFFDYVPVKGEITIKDTRTKSGGRVEVGEGGGTGWSRVEGRGENADNWNWIKINKKINKRNNTSTRKIITKKLCY